jgi:TolB protein
MRYARPVLTAATLVAAVACHGGAAHPPTAAPAPAVAPRAAEPHLANIRQLTHGGENAEAYFSTDGKRLIFQSTRDGRSCDQEYVMNADGSAQQRISDGTGKTTCGYFFAYNTKVFYSSTRAADTACPRKPDPSRGYVWGLDKYDIYTANADGSGTRRLTRNNVYTAEGTLSPDGKTIVFTSLKDGDLDIYTMNVDGTSVRRLTNTTGYDGGPFFSPDGKRIVYRAYHPTDSTELAQYRDLLSQSIVRPNKMEIWVMNADGSDQHQITHLGGANFAPFFTPDGRRIIFSSNYTSPHSGEFDLYLINDDGSSLEPVTNATGFDGFPQFSPDGKQLVWASSRNATGEHQLDLFIADWKP